MIEDAKSAPPALGIIVPCFDEEEVLPETARRLQDLIRELIESGKIAAASRIWFVDDGSGDHTWSLIDAYAGSRGSAVVGLKLSRNRGHQIALLAGLMEAEGDVLVSIDADLQDDPGVIPEMIDRFAAGSEVVYGVRSGRGTDTLFKRFTAEMYYRILGRLGIEVVFNHADFRLLGRRVVEALRQHGEGDVFLRGLVPQRGFRSSSVLYRRAESVRSRCRFASRRRRADRTQLFHAEILSRHALRLGAGQRGQRPVRRPVADRPR